MKTQLVTLELDIRSRRPIAREYTLDLADMVTLIDWDNPDEAKEQLREISDKYEPVSIPQLPSLDEYKDESYFVKGVSILAEDDYFVDLRGSKRSVPKKVRFGEGDGVHGVLLFRVNEQGWVTSSSKNEFFIEDARIKLMSVSEFKSKAGIFEINYRMTNDRHYERENAEKAIEDALDKGLIIIHRDEQRDAVMDFFDKKPSLRRRVFGV